MAAKKKQNAKDQANPVENTLQYLVDTNEIEALLIQIRDKLELICQDVKRQRGT